MREARISYPASRTPRMRAIVGAALLLIVSVTSVEAQSSKRENGVSRARAARAERAKSTVTGTAAGTLATTAVAAKPATPAAAEPMPRFESVLKAMSEAPALGNQFVRIRMLAPDQIQLVDVRNVFRERAEQERFEAAVAQHDRAITALRSTLQNSITLRDLLYDKQLSMSQVVAVDVLSEGKGAVVYYRND